MSAPPSSTLRDELAYPGMRIGLFGGSFNPPHAGHLHVARTAKTRLQLDRVWWLVSPGNPLKDPREIDDFDRRFALVEALARGPGMVVSDVERRLGTRYTKETLAIIRAGWAGVRFVWIMGADNLATFHRWRGWTGIMATVPVAVVSRPGATLSARLGPAAQRFQHARIDASAAHRLADMAPPAWVYLTAPLHPASSTALRSQAG